MRRKKIRHTKRGLAQDKKRTSKEPWERGRGAKRKGNPRYKPGTCYNKRLHKRVKCYRLRK